MPRNTDTAAASKRHRELKQERLTKYNLGPKPCLTCKTPLPYEDHKRRKFCSKSCSAIYNNRGVVRNGTPAVLRCPNCDQRVLNKRQRCCSAKCASEFRRKTNVAKWLSGEISGSDKDGNLLRWIRDYLMETPGKCEVCGWDKIHPYTGNKVLQVHHIDDIYSNNRPENLQVLCPNHHTMTENFGSRNKGNGRPYRWLLK